MQSRCHFVNCVFGHIVVEDLIKKHLISCDQRRGHNPYIHYEKWIQMFFLCDTNFRFFLSLRSVLSRNHRMNGTAAALRISISRPAKTSWSAIHEHGDWQMASWRSSLGSLPWYRWVTSRWSFDFPIDITDCRPPYDSFFLLNCVCLFLKFHWITFPCQVNDPDSLIWIVSTLHEYV